MYLHEGIMLRTTIYAAVKPNCIAHKRVNGTGMANTSPARMAVASVSLLSISQTLRFLQNDMDQ